jgi:hypothetical protein
MIKENTVLREYWRLKKRVQRAKEAKVTFYVYLLT